MLTAERAREVLSYDPETGEVRWRIRMGSRAPVGGLVGKIEPASGYMNVRIDKAPYRLHRVIWLMQTGEWVDQVDHGNRVRHDNRWDNLNPSNNALNRQNVELARKDSTTGLKGVRVDKRRAGQFSAVIKRDGQHYWLGTFNTPEEAHAAYLAAKAQLHPAWVPSEGVLDGLRLTDNHLLNARGERRIRIDSRTGLLGVYPHQGRFAARFKRKYIGMFDSPEKAHEAVMAAKSALLEVGAP